MNRFNLSSHTHNENNAKINVLPLTHDSTQLSPCYPFMHTFLTFHRLVLNHLVN